MLANIFLLLGGLFLLIYSADRLVKGATSIADHLNVQPLIIGLTVVAFGTSAPELAVSVFAAWQGNPEIALGNVFGSNVANIFLALGLMAATTPVIVSRSTIWLQTPFILLSVILVLVLGADSALSKSGLDLLSRTDGLTLLIFFTIFLYYSARTAKNSGDKKIKITAVNLKTAIFFVSVGLVGLTLGGKFIVDSAVALASLFDISEHLIAITIVAVGTSLPELATSLVATKRNQIDLAVGNLIGSNIFNTLFVLGASALVAPLPFGTKNYYDLMFCVLAAILLFVSMFVGGRGRLDRWQGWIFLGLYVIYLFVSISINGR